MNVRALLGLGIAAALPLSACGSSSSSGGTLTKDQWLTQANAICQQAHAQTSAIPQPTSAAGVAPALTQTITIVQAAVDNLKALKNPAEIQSDLDAFIKASENTIDIAKKAQSQFAAGDSNGAMATIQQLDTADQASDPLATKLGLTECAKH